MESTEDLKADKPAELPVTEIMTPPEPVPIAIVAPAAIEEPAKPALETNRIEIVTPLNPFHCPQCSWTPPPSTDPATRERSLAAHIRFKHDLPKARKVAAERKASGQADVNGQPLPPPDFTDIGEGTAQPAPNVVTAEARFETMANMTFDMSTGILARVFGPEWESKDPDERATMVLAIKKYYQSVNLPDLPPGYILCFCCIAYAAPRLGAQPTRTKLAAGWLWLKSKFARKRTMTPIRILETKAAL